MDAREWEEEQIRLDRDWYSGAEEGGLMGDEEHNPLAQYEDLAAIKQAEIAKKQVVRAHSLFLKWYISYIPCRRRSRRGKHNT